MERAVLCSLDAGASGYLADPQLKAQAAHYLQQLSTSEQGWKLALQHFSHSSYAQVKFWALQVSTPHADEHILHHHPILRLSWRLVQTAVAALPATSPAACSV